MRVCCSCDGIAFVDGDPDVGENSTVSSSLGVTEDDEGPDSWSCKDKNSISSMSPCSSQAFSVYEGHSDIILA